MVASNAIKINMRNRTEVSLSNPSLFPDVTAWRAIRQANKANTQKADVFLEEPNLKSQPPGKKSQLHQELTKLNMLEKK